MKTTHKKYFNNPNKTMYNIEKKINKLLFYKK